MHDSMSGSKATAPKGLDASPTSGAPGAVTSALRGKGFADQVAPVQRKVVP